MSHLFTFHGRDKKLMEKNGKTVVKNAQKNKAFFVHSTKPF